MLRNTEFIQIATRHKRRQVIRYWSESDPILAIRTSAFARRVAIAISLWAGILMLLVALVAVATMTDWKLPVALFTASVTILHFSIRHNLAEVQLGAELFQRFNERYDELNDALNEITKDESSVDESERNKTLDDYFNLCAEEYYFYVRGYIDPEVWIVWHRGMMTLLDCVAVAEYWNKERLQVSHYGLERVLFPPRKPDLKLAA